MEPPARRRLWRQESPHGRPVIRRFRRGMRTHLSGGERGNGLCRRAGDGAMDGFRLNAWRDIVEADIHWMGDG